MTVPEIVRERLADEEIAARVALGGDDELLVTPSRTLVYRAEGLLSGESVEEYSHEAERLSVSDGRRKSTISLDHGIEGETEFTIPKRSLDEALPPVLGGVLRSAGVTEADEDVQEVYRLGELTIVITDGRVIKHIGSAVWDEEYEEYALADVTRLEVEEGDVSSQILLEVNGRPQRIKTPSEDARQVREHIERALLAHHDVGSYQSFLRTVAPEEDADARGAEDSGQGGDPEEAEAGSRTEEESAGSTTASGSAGIGLQFDEMEPFDIDEEGEESEPPAESGAVADELAALRESVERQNELLANQQAMIEQLIEELRRGR